MAPRRQARLSHRSSLRRGREGALAGLGPVVASACASGRPGSHSEPTAARRRPVARDGPQEQVERAGGGFRCLAARRERGACDDGGEHGQEHEGSPLRGPAGAPARRPARQVRPARRRAATGSRHAAGLPVFCPCASSAPVPFRSHPAVLAAAGLTEPSNAERKTTRSGALRGVLTVGSGDAEKRAGSGRPGAGQPARRTRPGGVGGSAGTVAPRRAAARNSREWPGRGRGSVSRPVPEAAEIAAALARHARQGRDLRLAVLDWFAEAGLAAVLDTEIPEPPERAVLAALEHVTAVSPWYELFTRPARRRPIPRKTSSTPSLAPPPPHCRRQRNGSTPPWYGLPCWQGRSRNRRSCRCGTA